MGIVFALLAAMCNAVSISLQRQAGSKVPIAQASQLGSFWASLRELSWWMGIGVTVAASVFQILALNILPVTLVQSIMPAEMVFLLPVMALWRQPINRREVWGACLIAAGLSSFLLLAHPMQGQLPGSTLIWVGALVGWAFLEISLIINQKGRKPVVRATILGVAGGVAYGMTAALIKATLFLLHRGPMAIFASWQLYALGAVGISAIFFAQNAFQAGTLAASQPGLVAADMLVGISIGLLVFGEKIHHSPSIIAGELLAILAIVTGVVLLASSPTLFERRL